MMRRTAVFPIGDLAGCKQQLLAWADSHDVAVYLDSNEHHSVYGSWECLVGAGVVNSIQASAGTAFAALQAFQESHHDWLFGFLGYDLKNEVEQLTSSNFDGLSWPDLYFFQPEAVAGIRHGHLEIFSLTDAPPTIWQSIQHAAVAPAKDEHAPGVTPLVLHPRFSKPDYLSTVEAIRQHIVAGDVYELNLCQEFYAEQASLDPLRVFTRLNALARAPFSAYFRWQERYLLCASPERFLQKTGRQLLSQPIKGTRRRGRTPEEDTRIRAELSASEKDRAENVMIVDLVRNDLARHCVAGSVRVEELFGLHTFATVHQLISTVSGHLRTDAHPLNALRDAFPMGSMTGAPKVRAMELIEHYEKSRRGLFSGAVGYFTPEGDFDFNVVIRSILYNAASGYVSAPVGSAIIYDSVPEEEYAECLVKLEALLRSLGSESEFSEF